MKKIFGVCYKIGLIGEIIGLLFAIYTTSCSEQFSVLFSIIIVPFTVIFACAIFAYFKLPMEERPKPTRTWAVVHHPIGQFATLLTINVLLILVAQNQANSHVIKKFSEVSAVNLTDAKKASVTNSNATNNNYFMKVACTH